MTRPRTEVRLAAAALLCLLPLGLLWSSRPGVLLPGTTVDGFCNGNGYCVPDTYIPGYYTPGHAQLVAQSPVRVFLVLAAVALIWVATRTRTNRTLRVGRLAAASIAVTAVLAAANGAVAVLACSLAALALLARPLRPRPQGPGGGRTSVLADERSRR